MNIPQPTELADQLAHTAEQIAEKIDTQDLKDRASTGASELLDAATTPEGRPRKGLIIGAVVALVVLFLARRALR